MATTSGEQGSDLKFEAVRKMLENEPYRVHFFQAVRLMERLYPERNPVGLFVTPDSEVVRFSSVPTLVLSCQRDSIVRAPRRWAG